MDGMMKKESSRKIDKLNKTAPTEEKQIAGTRRSIVVGCPFRVEEGLMAGNASADRKTEIRDFVNLSREERNEAPQRNVPRLASLQS